MGAVGGGAGTAQETRSHLPGAGQQRRAAAQLRQPGADLASLGAAGGGAWPCTRRKKPSAWSWATRTVCRSSYGNQALILQAWGRLEEALALHKKKEAICLELGNKDGMQASYGNQALILQAWGRLEEALALHKKEEAICLELGNKDGLQRSYGNQALILHSWGRLDEALALHKKEEAICLELGNKDGLQRSYGNQALILIKQGRLAEALTLLQRSEAICLELGQTRVASAIATGSGLIWRPHGRPRRPTAEAPAGPRPLHRTQHAPRARRRPGRTRPTPLRRLLDQCQIHDAAGSHSVAERRCAFRRGRQPAHHAAQKPPAAERRLCRPTPKM